ncbi:cupin domain-containing protein [Streptomyces sp. NPDC101733]|uniref:cupin domain-containing protein n=1 Tax=unclassified Streptomyces TaxID=2593676 RepID=UPI0038196818
MGGRQVMARRSGTTAPSELMLREVVIPAGGCTGWHYHRVPLMAVVKSGTLTRILADESREEHTAGDTFVEPAGTGHIHLGRNLGEEPILLHVTCPLASDDAFAVAVAAPPGAMPCGCPEHAG